MAEKIKVFIVDDSAVVRTALGAILSSQKDIELCGSAADPIIAMDKFSKAGWPDVVILDIEMPRMNGLDFLRQIMKERPTPVIICSSIAKSGSKAAIEALSIGAVDVFAKPELGVKEYLDDTKERILNAIKSAAMAKNRFKISMNAMKSAPIPASELEKHAADEVLRLNSKHVGLTHKIVAIGSSTGGVQAIEIVLRNLHANVAPIVITQHIPQGFSKSLADRLNSICQVNVKEAENGDKLLRGRVLIAPGDRHMLIKKQGDSYIVEIKDGPKISRHKPSVDVLFRSCANEAGSNAVGFILTGMGDDGAKGIKEMKDRGSKTYAQDEASCVVFGMPKEAIAIGGISEVVGLLSIAEIIKKI